MEVYKLCLHYCILYKFCGLGTIIIGSVSALGMRLGQVVQNCIGPPRAINKCLTEYLAIAIHVIQDSLLPHFHHFRSISISISVSTVPGFTPSRIRS